MRLARTAVTVAAAAALTLAGAAPALAATTDAVPAAASISTGTTWAGVTEPGHLSLGSTSARPGATVTFSGTCPTQAGPGFPTVTSVTSPAFASSSLGKTDPYAFTGTATVSSSVAPGTYTVTAHCSNGAATASLVVTGGSTPDHGGSGGTTGGSTGAGAGAGHAATVSDRTASERTASERTPADGGDGITSAATVPLAADADAIAPWVIGGVAVAAAAAAGAYALGRGRAADRERELAGYGPVGADGTRLQGPAEAPTERMRAPRR